jgi:hypothetical protein
MTAARVWILYEPAIYADLFQCLFERLGLVKVIRRANTNGESFESPDLEGVDVIVLPLSEAGEPRTEMLERPFPDAKILAFSPDGARGLRRLPGETRWEELRPFGLSDLMFEVLRAA